MAFFKLDLLYYSNTKIKWIILIVSGLICSGSIFYTNILVEQLKVREHNQVELYAAALQFLANEAVYEILFISEEIIGKNYFIPTVMVDQKNHILSHTNIKLDSSWDNEKKKVNFEVNWQ